MKTKIKAVLLMCLAAVLVASIALAGCAAPEEAAVEKGPIKLAMVTDMTGPAHEQVMWCGWAAEDFAKWVNEQGGISGHPVEMEVVDTKYDLTLIRTAYKRLRTEVVSMSFDAQSHAYDALGDMFRMDEMPVLLTTGAGSALYPPGYVFSCMAPYDDRCCGMVDWIVANWEETRRPRLALLLGDYSSGRIAEQAEWYIEGKGVDLVAKEIVPWGPTDTTDQWVRIRDANPDYIYDTLCPDMMKVALMDKHRLGVDIPQLNFFWNSAIIRDTVPGEAYDGLMGMYSIYQWFNADKPGVKLVESIWTDYGHRTAAASNVTNCYIMAMASLFMQEEAIRLAIEQVGYEDLTPPAVYDGFCSIKNFDCRGLTKPFSLSKDKPRGQGGVQIGMLHKDGTVSIVCDWIECPWHLKLKAERGE